MYTSYYTLLFVQAEERRSSLRRLRRTQGRRQLAWRSLQGLYAGDGLRGVRLRSRKRLPTLKKIDDNK